MVDIVERLREVAGAAPRFGEALLLAAAEIERLRHTLTVIAEAAEEFDDTVNRFGFARGTAERARSALGGESRPTCPACVDGVTLNPVSEAPMPCPRCAP